MQNFPGAMLPNPPERIIMLMHANGDDAECSYTIWPAVVCCIRSPCKHCVQGYMCNFYACF